MGKGKFEGMLLVVDYDDTFCPVHGGAVPEENLLAAQYFMDEGGYFTIATGRDVRSYYSIREKFTVNAPLMLSNGAVIFDGESGESWYESFLPFSCRDELTAVRDAFPGTGMEVHRGADVRVCGKNPGLEAHLAAMGVPVSEADPGHILYPWTKVVLVAPGELRQENETAHAICAYVRERFPGKYEASPSGALADIVAAGSDKGSGVRRLADFLDIHPENVVCIGDGWNDLPMLRTAGRAYAPESALPEIFSLEAVTKLGAAERCVRDALAKIEAERK